MKIEHVRLDPETGSYFAILSGLGVVEACSGSAPGLRCGAYRFSVRQVVKQFPEASLPTIAVLLDFVDPPQEGMVFHRDDEPLTDEELAVAVQHLLMLSRLLKGIDAHGVAARVSRALGPQRPGELNFLLDTLQQFALCVAELTDDVPLNSIFEDLERYKSEILKAC